MKDEKHHGPRAKGALDRDAYSDARRLWGETGDIRYAAIAIGKSGLGKRQANGEVRWTNEIPEWAMQACFEFANEIEDVLHAVAAIGHAISDAPSGDGLTRPSDGIPQWALRRCVTFAEEVRTATNSERNQMKDGTGKFNRPAIHRADYEGVRKLMANNEGMTRYQAYDELPIDNESNRRGVDRLFKEDELVRTDAESDGAEGKIEKGSRRDEERMVARRAKRTLE
ncbi:hypothetical protein OF122_03625 [Pelagibacterium flavum]|uniref:Terminase small subunit n=1 Tax=Pelagibacterium flavum TaxID=2984530 RepID=A0ABY6IQJ9_9HYPH|nr:hypothetical protein [Pelagibacterium sp. YIM 151497]UYQ72876.1 hypothetical protein OF122_03625 [Pelagibacterium sp. YIM 151497]